MLNSRAAFIWIFAFSLILRVWFNFFINCGNAAFACDAAEYLRHAQNLNLSLKSLFVDNPGSYLTCINVLLGQASITDIAFIKAIFSPLQSMSISGPVFPVFILVCYKLCGQNPSMLTWTIPVMVQSILSAAACVLIALISSTCWNRSIGICAGLIAALYPGFIINSGRLYSESFASFLLCFILWLVINYLVKGKNHYVWGLLLGISLFSLQTTRSVMCLLSLTIVITLIVSSILVAEKRKRTNKYLLAMLLGFLLCLLPWLALQKLAFGKTSLIVDRVSNYNLFVGNNVDCLGWLSIPYPDLSGIDNQKYSEIIKRAIKTSPQRFLKLCLDKPTRLFKLPWNDFRVTIGPISLSIQAIFHQLIFVLAALGLPLGLYYAQENVRQAKTLARYFIFYTFLLHLLYLAFITVPRYALTAMPEVIIFAAVGLTGILTAFRSRSSAFIALRLLLVLVLLMFISRLDLVIMLNQIESDSTMQTQIVLVASILLKMAVLCLFFAACWQLITRLVSSANHKYALGSIILIALFALPAYCLPLRAHGRWYEWSKDFQTTGEQTERIVILSQQQAEQIKQRQAYLAINIAGGSNLPNDWNLSINNTTIDGPYIPTMALAQDLSLVHLANSRHFTIESEFVLNCLCDPCSISPLDLRQWYLIPISTSKWQSILDSAGSTNKSGECKLEIVMRKCADSPSTLYGAYPVNKNFSIMPSLFRFSWEKAFYGVENQIGLSDPAYDQKIEIGQKRNLSDSLVTVGSDNKRNGNNNIYLKLLIPESPQITKLGDRINYASTNVLRLRDTMCNKADFSSSKARLSFKPKNSALAKNNKDTYWIVRFFGQIENSDMKQLTIQPIIYFTNSNKQAPEHICSFSFTSPWLPKSIKARAGSINNPAKFDICFPMLISAFPKTVDHIELNLFKDNIHKDALPPNSAYSGPAKCAHTKCYLEIYQMNKALSGVHYEIL